MPFRGPRKRARPLHHVRIHGEMCSLEVGRHLITLAPWSWTANFQNWEKQIPVDYKLPSLLYFVTAA